jgi:hypothetical protein
MHVAGDPEKDTAFKKDGKLQTWLAGPGLDPVMVLDRQDLAWRQYNNVSINTLYFSVFFGGSNPTFQASKDEVRVYAVSGLCESSSVSTDYSTPQKNRSR